jgi:glycine/D-amino acid oxidase-like deaminating enzyme
MSHVTVIGAGIVGACCARYLALAGHEVTLVDRLLPGMGCSFGNAGVISTVSSSVQPPSPRLLKSIPGMLFDRDATLVMRWSYLARMAPWLIALLKGCTAADQRRTAAAMASLLTGTTAAYDRIVKGTEADRYIRRNGMIGLYRTEETFAGDAWRRDMNRELGAEFTELASEEIRQMEPSLSEEVRRAVFFPTAYSSSNPSLLTRAIAADAGAFVQAEVDDIRIENGRATALVTDKGDMPVDKLVVAAGAFSHRLARMMGIRVLLDTERGYHVELDGVETALGRACLHYEHAFGINPVTTGLRFAGTVEFAGVDAPENDARAHTIWRRARPVLRELEGLDKPPMRLWMGRRPTMPDFRPVIGGAPGVGNCWFAFGHQHLGLTLAARTGEIVAELIGGRDPGIDLQPFRADRF